MKLRLFGATLVCAALLALAPAAQAENVRADWNHNVDFSRLHTYSWGTVKVSGSSGAQHVQSAVNDALRKKGWQQVASGGQVTINILDHVRDEKQAETFYSGLGGGWGQGWGWSGWGWHGSGPGGFGESQTNVHTVPVGHLVIDMFDSQSKQLIWRGITQDEVQASPNQQQHTLDQGIHKLFSSFPPKSQ